MGFHEVSFPLPLAYGTSAGPGYSSSVVQLRSGATQRVATWEDPLHVYDALDAVRDEASMSTLKAFYIARRGSLNGFRLKDPGDYSTGANDRGAPAAGDVLLGYGDGSKTEFQLVKRYNPATDYEWVRTIRKPVSGSVLVSVAGVTTSGFTLDTTTGKLTLSTPPANGAAVRAGFRFDVPVFFAPEADRLLSISFAQFNDHRVQVPMIEDRADYQTPAGYLYGQAQESTNPGADIQVSPLVARLWIISGSVSNGAGWRLPDASGLKLGGPLFALSNQTSDLLAIRDASGTLVQTIPGLTTYQVYLGQLASGQKRWVFAR
jgi:uncharacterized protein (TIGR02217 family)